MSVPAKHFPLQDPAMPLNQGFGNFINASLASLLYLLLEHGTAPPQRDGTTARAPIRASFCSLPVHTRGSLRPCGRSGQGSHRNTVDSVLLPSERPRLPALPRLTHLLPKCALALLSHERGCPSAAEARGFSSTLLWHRVELRDFRVQRSSRSRDVPRHRGSASGPALPRLCP